MANRFYVPTPTRYTSQFVEERYPFDAMLALEQQKVQRAENISAGEGELMSLLGPLTTPGHFTQEESQIAQQELAGKIEKFRTTHEDDMTSINTIRDLSKLRGEILNDPRVKAMELDREVWSPQWDQVRLNRKSNLDIDPNLTDPNQPELGVTQWHPGQSYPVIQPLQGMVDWQKPILDIYNQMTPRITSKPVSETTAEGVPFTGIRTYTNLTDQDILPVAQGLANDIIEGNIQGSTEAADSYKRQFRLKYGRDPDYETVLKDMIDLSPAFIVKGDELSNVNWGTKPESGTPPKTGERGGAELGVAMRRGTNYTPTPGLRATASGEVKADLSSGIDIHSILRNITSPGQKGSPETREGTELPNVELRTEFNEDTNQQMAEGIYLHPEAFEHIKSLLKPEKIKDANGIETIDEEAVKYNKVIVAKATEDYINNLVTEAIYPVKEFLTPDDSKYINEITNFKTVESIDSKGNKAVSFTEIGANEKAKYYVELGRPIDERKNAAGLKKDYGFTALNSSETLGNQNFYWPQALVENMFIPNANKDEKAPEIVRFNPTFLKRPTAWGDYSEWRGWNFVNGVSPRVIYPLSPNDFVDYDAQDLRKKSFDEQYEYIYNKRMPYMVTYFDPTLQEYEFEDKTKGMYPRYHVVSYRFNDKGEEVKLKEAEGISREGAWNAFVEAAGSQVAK